MVHFPAGSAEARAHMDALRAMRGKTKGGSLKSVARAARKGLKHASHVLGDVAQGVKKVVPKKMVKSIAAKAISAAATMAGRPDLAANATRAMEAGVDATYRTNLSKGSVGKNFVHNYEAAGGPSAASIAGGALHGQLNFQEVVWAKQGMPMSQIMARRRQRGVRGAGFTPTGVQSLSATDRLSGKFTTNVNNIRGAKLPSKISLVKGAGFIPAGRS